MQDQSKGKSTIRTAVVLIVAIHLVFFGGLLMQGCKRNNTPGTANVATNKLTFPPIETKIENPYVSNAPTNPPEPAAPAPQSNAPASVVSKPEPDPTPAPAATGEAREYVVVKGDTFSGIAKALHVSVAAIAKANPNADPARLKVGQKLQIPAPVAVAAKNGAPESAAAEGTYVIKAGDTLTKIAREHGTTVKALRTANGLKTDRVAVGKKLKLPPPTKTAEGGTGATNQ